MAANPWGYHRLAEPWAGRLVAAAGVRRGEFVLDVGAGEGAITAALVAAGARVLAVELHPARLRVLRERFDAAPVRVVRADAGDLWLPRRPFRVVANPPFSVTSSLLRRLLDHRGAMYAADLVLPRAVVAHYVRRGAVGWRLERGSTVPSGAFRPAVAKDCAVLVARRSRR